MPSPKEVVTVEIVTKTNTELDILLANPADPNNLMATTKQLKSLNVYTMKLERERDALPAFDEKVQAELTDGQELEDDIIEADDIQTIIALKLLDLETLVSRLPRGHTSHPSVGLPTRSTSTTPIIGNGDPCPLPPHDRQDRPASSPTQPIAAAATTPFSVSNSSTCIVLAAGTDAANPPPSNDVRLPNLAPSKFSNDRSLDWQTSLTAGVDRINLCAGVQQFHNVRARLRLLLEKAKTMDVERVRADLLQAYEVDLPEAEHLNVELRVWKTKWSSVPSEMKVPSTVEDTLKSVSGQELLFPNCFASPEAAAGHPRDNHVRGAC